MKKDLKMREIVEMNKEELTDYILENESIEVIADICNTSASFVEAVMKYAPKNVVRETVLSSISRKLGIFASLIIIGARENKSYYPFLTGEMADVSNTFSYRLKDYTKELDNSVFDKVGYLMLDITSDLDDIDYDCFNNYAIKSFKVLDTERNVIPEFDKSRFSKYQAMIEDFQGYIADDVETLLSNYDGETMEVPVCPHRY